MKDATGDELDPDLQKAELATGLEEAMREARRLERVEQQSDLERLQQTNEKIVAALSARARPNPN